MSPSKNLIRCRLRIIKFSKQKEPFFFFKVDDLRKRHENDTVYVKFSLRHWFKSVSWKENKNKTFRPWDLAAATLSCAFISVSSDQRKNGAAAVSMHSLTLVYKSFRPPVSPNTSLFQLRWQKLFIAHLSGVIKEIYLSLHPYLQPKLINRPPHFQPVSLRASVILACIKAPTHDRLTNQAYL